MGYDNPDATARALQKHADGRIWLHTGDIGYMNEDGVIYVQTRGKAPVLAAATWPPCPWKTLWPTLTLPALMMSFFVLVPDVEHTGYFLPYLFVVLKEGYRISDIEKPVRACLKPLYAAGGDPPAGKSAPSSTLRATASA